MLFPYLVVGDSSQTPILRVIEAHYHEDPSKFTGPLQQLQSLRAAGVDESCVASSLRVRILQYITDNLHDPELTPTRIAQVFRITPRYLHRLFLQEKQTAARYILSQRLERARAALVDPLMYGQSLTRISGDLGFKSLPHFSHVFHDVCGMSPSDYRDASRS